MNRNGILFTVLLFLATGFIQSAFAERMKYFSFKTPHLKKVNTKYLQNLAIEILNE